MSPLLFPKGFTRDYLDGKIERTDLIEKIKSAFGAINENHDITVVEGTGHTAVGSIVGLNNAQVAALLGIPIILVASGGLGSAFDELSLNYIQCQKYGAQVAGVILNRVLDDKRKMILNYMPKALKIWNVPLLGLIPFDPFLTTPTMSDFELLFEQKLLSGAKESLHHFDQVKLITSSIEIESPESLSNQLLMTSADQEEMILDILKKQKELSIHIGFILTGASPPSSLLLQKLQSAKIPTLFIPLTSTKVIQMINSHVGKIRKEDTSKIAEAIQIVEKNIDFDKLIKTIFN
jgi:BioD-like phosphotransacetylase family protein